jgi:hypothetical protein
MAYLAASAIRAISNTPSPHYWTFKILDRARKASI